MNRRTTVGGLYLAMTVLMGLCSAFIASAKEARIAELAPTGEELGESNVEAVAEEIHQIELTEAQRTIVIGKDGVITIPPGAAHSTVNTDKLKVQQRAANSRNNP